MLIYKVSAWLHDSSLLLKLKIFLDYMQFPFHCTRLGINCSNNSAVALYATCVTLFMEELFQYPLFLYYYELFRVWKWAIWLYQRCSWWGRQYVNIGVLLRGIESRLSCAAAINWRVVGWHCWKLRCGFTYRRIYCGFCRPLINWRISISVRAWAAISIPSLGMVWSNLCLSRYADEANMFPGVYCVLRNSILRDNEIF